MDSTDFNIKLNPAVIVIFGITGDLSTRKLLPALYQLTRNGLLHEKTRVVGVTRRQVELDSLLDRAKVCVRDKDGECDEQALGELTKRLELYQMNAAEADGYSGLQAYLDKLEDEVGMCVSRLFYLSIPPQISTPIIRHLGQQGLNQGCKKHDAKARLLLEKPFGFDMRTAEELVAETTKYFDESQIFRIDHYLAKETVQNIVTFRFRNPIFEGIWNNRHISSIEVVADEKLDIEGRANFYEQTGALRDLIQSHLMHVMSVVMMDKPADITDADAMHSSRLALLNSIEAVPVDRLDRRAIRGQYDGYRQEVDNDDSYVETYAALKLFSRLETWRGVPIYLRTGKALASKQTAVTISFKPEAADHDHINQLTFNIQPNEGIQIQLWVKRPGFERRLQTAPMSFRYDQTFDEHGHPDAYERVLVDAIRGDHMLFATSDEVLSAWRIIEPVITNWAQDSNSLKAYTKASAGPDLSKMEED
ncbi:MAG TPA: glucose-6-phosphate dehydrogenase [Candidatus Saccharimonadales bacterium]|nr:glucose-6-phosphate dehydrogenase [Candidatus Saccharimonadales bacterium]